MPPWYANRQDAPKIRIHILPRSLGLILIGGGGGGGGVSTVDITVCVVVVKDTHRQTLLCAGG